MQIQDPQMEKGIASTLDCYKVCLETMRHCLTQGGVHAEVRHIMRLSDCAKICNTAADFMARNSLSHKQVCGLCADICISCAESCEELPGEEMKRCADICRQCAATCRSMSQ